MPPEITGPGGAAGGVPIAPAAPLRPATPSRALTPIEKAGPRAPGDSPLGRSGVALQDLLLAPDLLETRDAVAPVAMELGMETARRQLLQRQPAESLASLDGVWARASGSEEGWYLRAGALTVLGHPLEGDRVATAGLSSQPQSLALRLLQSVARAVVGDLSGARAALQSALNTAPGDPVLLAQQAVVLARQGHADDASLVLDRLAVDVPDHPALVWAKASVRLAAADRTRNAARSTWAADAAEERSSASQARVDGDLVPEVGRTEADPAEGDLVASAFRRLGAQLRTQSDESLMYEARTLLRACSAGGTLASACTPTEAHGARQLLSAVLTVMRADSPPDAAVVRNASPVTPLVQQLMPLLRSERQGASQPMAADAERVLRRHGAAVPPTIRHLIGLLVQGAEDPRPQSGSSAQTQSRLGGADVPHIGRVDEEVELGPLVPVRLGLSLLGETAASRALERQQEVHDPRGAMLTPSQIVNGAVFDPSDPTLIVGRANVAAGDIGWGAGRAAGEQQRGEPTTGSAAFPVILLVAGAVAAAINGAATIAAVLGGIAVFLVLRSRAQPR